LHGIPEDSRIMTDGRFLKEEKVHQKMKSIENLNQLAQERGETLAQMALKWVLKDHDITSVLIGASRPEQILDNLEVMNSADFTEEELRLIDSYSVDQ
ncbi:MAG: aldo/keto reductase, partial [Lachnoclostridium sp.]|nr:aldo/keto reductase [Lachnoclostridium sp.]